MTKDTSFRWCMARSGSSYSNMPKRNAAKSSTKDSSPVTAPFIYWKNSRAGLVMNPSGRFSLVRIIWGTGGAGKCDVLKKVAASTVLTWILNAVSSLSVQSLPDLADKMMFAMVWRLCRKWIQPCLASAVAYVITIVGTRLIPPPHSFALLSFFTPPPRSLLPAPIYIILLLAHPTLE